MYFPGTTDSIRINGVRPTNVMTVSQWLKAPSSGHGFSYSIATLGANTDWAGFSMYHANANSLQFQIQTSDTPYVTTSININDNTWHHVMGVYNGSDIRIYLDGVEQGSPTSVTGDITYRSDDIVDIGSYSNGSLDFNGNISNTAMWHRALTQDEILRVYNGGSPGDLTNLGPTGWWSLGADSYFDGADWICPDLSTNSNNGTSVNLGADDLVGDGPDSLANGTSTNLDLGSDLIGEAPGSTGNAISINMNSLARTGSTP